MKNRVVAGIVSVMMLLPLNTSALAWGAFAVGQRPVGDVINGNIEIRVFGSNNLSTETAAFSSARNACLAAGYRFDRCSVDHTFNNACYGAAAGNDGRRSANAYFAVGTTAISAGIAARNACRGRYSNCRIWVQTCDTTTVTIPNPNPNPTPNPTPSPATSSGGGGGDSGGNTFLYIGAGAAVVGLIALAVKSGSDEIPEPFFQPIASYTDNNGIRHWQAGGRFDWQMNDFSAYWTAATDSDNGFSYASGLEYKANFWTAKISDIVEGETIDYDFSLSANVREGLWEFSPLYHVNAKFNDSDVALKNELVFSALAQYHGWKVSPSAGLEWRDFDDFGDNQKLNLLLVYDL